MPYPTKKLWEIWYFLRWVTYKKWDLLDSYIDWCITLLRANNINDWLFLNNLQFLPTWFIDKKKILKKWDIIFCMSSWSKHLVWKNAIITKLENYSFWAFCSMFRLNTENNISYIYYFLRSDNYKNYIFNFSKGVNILNLKNSNLEGMPIPLPPLPTQKLIVKKLDSVFKNIDENIEKTKKNLENIEELNKSVLEEVFKEWKYEVKYIDEVSKRVQYWYTWKIIERWKIRYLRITDIQNNTIIWSNVPFVDIEKQEINKYSLNEWDIVFARTWATVWKSCLINKDWVWNIFASYLIRIVCKKEIVNPKFMKFFFYSQKYWEQIWLDVVWAAQPNFNWTKLKQVKIPLPPLKKQKEIVSYLDKVFEKNKVLKEKYEKRLKELEEMKQSILKEAFEWRLV